LTLNNIIHYNYGWGDLYEYENNNSRNIIEFNSKMSLSIEYIFIDFLSFGLTLENSNSLWPSYKEIDITAGSFLTYYFIQFDIFIPNFKLEFISSNKFEKENRILINHKKSSLDFRAGCLIILNNNFSLDTGLFYKRDFYKIKNELTGTNLGFNLGIKYKI